MVGLVIVVLLLSVFAFWLRGIVSFWPLSAFPRGNASLGFRLDLGVSENKGYLMLGSL